MLATVSRDQALIAFLALADMEKLARTPLLESSAFSAFLMLLVGIQPEVERVAVLTAASASVANALSSGVAAVNPRSMTRQFPREAPQLSLGAQRLRNSYAGHEVSAALNAFNGAVAAAKDQTVAYIVSGFASDVRPIAAAWRAASATGAHLLRAIDRAFGERQLAGLADATSPLISFLDEAAAGGYSAVSPRGEINLPLLREGREFKRVPVRCAATVHHNGQTYQANLHDMSVGGLGLEGLSGPAERAEIRVDFGGLSLKGCIEWLKDGRAGVKLEVPLEAEDPRLKFLSC
ncbi:MAG: PilZ domain-containing protein [Hyphomicrobium sp.]|jgi:hypothetical protein